MKTFSDLPVEFIEGIKSGEIIINPEKDDDLTKECLANFTANLCRKLPKRPLILLAFGDHIGHASSYIARISEDNQCELLSLNSSVSYSKPDKLFIESLKQGIQNALGLKEENFEEPIFKSFEQNSFICAFITSALLSLADPDRTLSEQADNLEKAMIGMIQNDQLTRRLIARIQWWNKVVYPKRDGNEKLKQAMGLLFKQLLYDVSKSKPSTKVSLPSDPEILQECAKFLNIFNIKINDKSFLKLFNKVEQNILDQSSEDIVDEHEKYFDTGNWENNKDEIINKLFNDDINETLKTAFEEALDDLAKHARLHLDSSSSTKRALSGQEKYDELSKLFQNNNDLESLQANIKKYLDTKSPDNSVLLKNRGGFFGAYKSFSRVANFFGAKHYKYGDRTAISRTDHYLIALYDVIDGIIKDKTDHGLSSSQ